MSTVAIALLTTIVYVGYLLHWWYRVRREESAEEMREARRRLSLDYRLEQLK